jgi:cytochrome P450
LVSVVELTLTDPELINDPAGVYGRAREQGAVARLGAPGFGPLWGVLRHAEARAMLADPRFALQADSYQRPDVPEHCRPYLRTMQEMEGPEHQRLRGLVAPAFSARRAADLRPRIEPIVNRLLDAAQDAAQNAAQGDGEVDLLRDFARPLPIEVICELVGVPVADRARWREYGAAVAAGHGKALADAVPAIIDSARQAVAHHAGAPATLPPDLVSDLLAVHAADGDRLGEIELVTLVWNLVLAGQTPTNLIANAVAALLAHPDQLAALRADPALLPRAVEELTRWCGPQLLTVPRFAQEDLDFAGVAIAKGDMVTVSIVAANRDPRAFRDPDRLAVGRAQGAAAHLGYAHGPHFCLGAPLARVQTELALAAVLRRFPALRLAPGERAERLPDPGTWRLGSLRVTS